MCEHEANEAVFYLDNLLYLPVEFGNQFTITHSLQESLLYTIQETHSITIVACSWRRH